MDDEKPRSSAGRKRGGQPGNTNAIKHGFYSKRLWREDMQPELGAEVALEDELMMLRSATLRLYKHMDELDVKKPDDLDLLGRLLGILSTAAVRIASMERALKAAQGKGDEILRALEEIHRRVLEERKPEEKGSKEGKKAQEG